MNVTLGPGPASDANRSHRWRRCVPAAVWVVLALAGLASAQVPFVRPPEAGPVGKASAARPVPISLFRLASVPVNSVPFTSVAVHPSTPTVPVSAESPFGQTPPEGSPGAGSLEEKFLLPLLLREQELLKHYGNEHPEVQAARARIQVVRDWLARQPAPRPEPIRPVSQPAPKPPRPRPDPKPPAPPEEARNRPAPPPAVVERIIEVRSAPAEPASSSRSVLIQLISILAALVVLLLVQVVALVTILRRHAGQLTPQVRLELVQSGTAGPSGPVPGEVLTQRVYLDAPDFPARRQPTEMPDLPDMRTCTDELAAQEEAAQQQDAAVFRQVFEDNLRLHEQLAEVGD
jgi:hypothetical protein